MQCTPPLNPQQNNLNFSVCIKIGSVFSHIWTKSQILSIYGQIRIRENPCFDIFHSVLNMVSVQYRHVYRMIIPTMVRSFFRHILYDLLTVAFYGNFLLLSINWPVLIIWLSNIPLYAYFFHRVLDIKILRFPHRARGLSVQMGWPRIHVKCNCSFYVPTWLVLDEKCATKIVNIATIRDYSDRQNMIRIFILNIWIEMQIMKQKLFDSNL